MLLTEPPPEDFVLKSVSLINITEQARFDLILFLNIKVRMHKRLGLRPGLDGIYPRGSTFASIWTFNLMIH